MSKQLFIDFICRDGRVVCLPALPPGAPPSFPEATGQERLIDWKEVARDDEKRAEKFSRKEVAARRRRNSKDRTLDGVDFLAEEKQTVPLNHFTGKSRTRPRTKTQNRKPQ